MLSNVGFDWDTSFEIINKIYEEMIKSEPTMNLRFRGLMEQYLKAQDYHHAFIYGEKLFSLNPRIEKLYETLIQIIAKTKNWNQIILLSDKAFSNKLINKNIINIVDQTVDFRVHLRGE